MREIPSRSQKSPAVNISGMPIRETGCLRNHLGRSNSTGSRPGLCSALPWDCHPCRHKGEGLWGVMIQMDCFFCQERQILKYLRFLVIRCLPSRSSPLTPSLSLWMLLFITGCLDLSSRNLSLNFYANFGLHQYFCTVLLTQSGRQWHFWITTWWEFVWWHVIKSIGDPCFYHHHNLHHHKMKAVRSLASSTLGGILGTYQLNQLLSERWKL